VELCTTTHLFSNIFLLKVGTTPEVFLREMARSFHHDPLGFNRIMTHIFPFYYICLLAFVDPRIRFPPCEIIFKEGSFGFAKTFLLKSPLYVCKCFRERNQSDTRSL
jgi:hypothetical protein